MGGILRSLGVVVGALSLFNLSSQLFNLNVAEVCEQFLAAYRAVFHPLTAPLVFPARWLLGLLGLDLPGWSRDLIVVWGVAVAAERRLYSRSKLENRDRRNLSEALKTLLETAVVSVPEMLRDACLIPISMFTRNGRLQTFSAFTAWRSHMRNPPKDMAGLMQAYIFHIRYFVVFEFYLVLTASILFIASNFFIVVQ